MSVHHHHHRRRRRRHRHLRVEVFFTVFSLAFISFDVATVEAIDRSPGDETLWENVTNHPDTVTSTLSGTSAVTSADDSQRKWSTIDYHTMPSSVAEDYRTIPSSMVNDYRTIPSSMVDDYRTISLTMDDRGQPIAHLLPPPVSVNGSHLLDLTEAADDRRPTGRPSATAAWNRYPYPSNDKRLNQYRPAITFPNEMTPPVYHDKYHSQSNANTKVSRPVYKTSSGLNAWTVVAPLIEIGLPWMAKLKAVKSTHWLLFMLGKLTALITIKVILFTKAFLMTKVMKLILLPVVPVLWSWFANKNKSSDFLDADTVKPSNILNAAGARNHINCQIMPRLCVRNNSSYGSSSSNRSNWSNGGPLSPYYISVDPAPTEDPDSTSGSAPLGSPNPPASSAFLTSQMLTSETATAHTTEFQQFRNRTSIRSAHQPPTTD